MALTPEEEAVLQELLQKKSQKPEYFPSLSDLKIGFCVLIPEKDDCESLIAWLDQKCIQYGVYFWTNTGHTRGLYRIKKEDWKMAGMPAFRIR